MEQPNGFLKLDPSRKECFHMKYFYRLENTSLMWNSKVDELFTNILNKELSATEE